MTTIYAALSAAVGRLRGHRHDDRGATAVEYGLMVALIAAVIAGIVLTLGNTLHSKFNDVNSCVGNSSSCSSSTTGP